MEQVCIKGITCPLHVGIVILRVEAVSRHVFREPLPHTYSGAMYHEVARVIKNWVTEEISTKWVSSKTK